MSAQRRGRKPPRTGEHVAESRQERWDRAARAAVDDAGGLDPGLLGDFLNRLAEPDYGRGWDRDADAAFAALGSRAAEQGVALRALVDLYLSAAWRVWPELPAVADDDVAVVRAAGQHVLRGCDDAVAAITDGYVSARRALVRREEAARREFVDDLLAGTADPAGLLARAESYGLQLAGAHTVVLARAATPFHEASPVLGEVAASLAGAPGSGNALTTTRDGELVVVLPELPRDDETAVLDAVRRIVVAHARRSPEVSMATGRAHPGPSGVARSFLEAREALALAERLRLPEPVARADDLLVYKVLLRDRAAMLELIDTVLSPLRHARGGAGPLLDTLERYLETGGNTTRTARALHLSVRAVTYRLDRIARLTGLHPADPAHRFTLHAAALGARAVGWPDEAVGSE